MSDTTPGGRQSGDMPLLLQFGQVDIEFVHHFRERYAGQGGYNEDHEFFGYRQSI